MLLVVISDGSNCYKSCLLLLLTDCLLSMFIFASLDQVQLKLKVNSDFGHNFPSFNKIGFFFEISVWNAMVSGVSIFALYQIEIILYFCVSCHVSVESFSWFIPNREEGSTVEKFVQNAGSLWQEGVRLFPPDLLPSHRCQTPETGV